MTARVAGHSVLTPTTKTAGATNVFLGGSGVTVMLSLEHWTKAKSYRPACLGIHYNNEVIPAQMEDYAFSSQMPMLKINYPVLKEQIEQIYRNRPKWNISYSDLMDAFPDADLMDIVQICSELVEEGKIAAVET